MDVAALSSGIERRILMLLNLSLLNLRVCSDYRTPGAGSLNLFFWSNEYFLSTFSQLEFAHGHRRPVRPSQSLQMVPGGARWPDGTPGAPGRRKTLISESCGRLTAWLTVADRENSARARAADVKRKAIQPNPIQACAPSLALELG